VKIIFIPFPWWIVGVSLAEPRTCWWSRTRQGSREDHLFGFSRTYTDRKYIYYFVAGRFKIGFLKK